VTDLYIVRSFQEVLFGFQSAMARFCRLLPRREGVQMREIVRENFRLHVMVEHGNLSALLPQI